MGIRLLPTDDAMMRLRLKRVLMAFASYLMFLPPLLIGMYAGEVSMGWGGVALFTMLMALASALAFVAIRTGWSRRFRDPSLMVLQLVFAIVLALAPGHLDPRRPDRRLQPPPPHGAAGRGA